MSLLMRVHPSTVQRIHVIAVALEVTAMAKKKLPGLLQNLRDEAHRFAIGTHRARRAKSIYKSRLDEIEGIGARRKRDLLNYFGSVEEISQAGLSDLQKVSGISKKTAEKIYNYFHI